MKTQRGSQNKQQTSSGSFFVSCRVINFQECTTPYTIPSTTHPQTLLMVWRASGGFTDLHTHIQTVINHICLSRSWKETLKSQTLVMLLFNRTSAQTEILQLSYTYIHSASPFGGGTAWALKHAIKPWGFPYMATTATHGQSGVSSGFWYARHGWLPRATSCWGRCHGIGKNI